jgi:hypothetical protein
MLVYCPLPLHSTVSIQPYCSVPHRKATGVCFYLKIKRRQLRESFRTSINPVCLIEIYQSFGYIILNYKQSLQLKYEVWPTSKKGSKEVAFLVLMLLCGRQSGKVEREIGGINMTCPKSIKTN